MAAFFPLGLTSTTPLRLTAKAASATNSQQRVLPMVWLTVPTVSAAAAAAAAVTASTVTASTVPMPIAAVAVAAAAAVAVAAAADLVTVFERCLEWMSAVISLFCAFLAVWPCAVLAYGYV